MLSMIAYRLAFKSLNLILQVGSYAPGSGRGLSTIQLTGKKIGDP